MDAKWKLSCLWGTNVRADCMAWDNATACNEVVCVWSRYPNSNEDKRSIGGGNMPKTTKYEELVNRIEKLADHYQRISEDAKPSDRAYYLYAVKILEEALDLSIGVSQDFRQ